MTGKGGPGSRGAKFKISRNGQVEYFHHGNSQHPSGHGLAHPTSPFAVKTGVKPMHKPAHKPVVIMKTAKGAEDNKKKSSSSELTKVAKPSKAKLNRTVNHHVATGHTNFTIKRG